MKLIRINVYILCGVVDPRLLPLSEPFYRWGAMGKRGCYSSTKLRRVLSRLRELHFCLTTVALIELGHREMLAGAEFTLNR